jgi:hypothetical protein
MVFLDVPMAQQYGATAGSINVVGRQANEPATSYTAGALL